VSLGFFCDLVNRKLFENLCFQAIRPPDFVAENMWEQVSTTTLLEKQERVILNTPTMDLLYAVLNLLTPKFYTLNKDSSFSERKLAIQEFLGTLTEDLDEAYNKKKLEEFLYETQEVIQNSFPDYWKGIIYVISLFLCQIGTLVYSGDSSTVPEVLEERTQLEFSLSTTNLIAIALIRRISYFHIIFSDNIWSEPQSNKQISLVRVFLPNSMTSNNTICISHTLSRVRKD